MLISIAERFRRYTLQRHLLFLAATLVTIVVIGYHFGTFDQFAHIPFLKKDVDPTLFPDDGFIALRQESYSYFWLAFAPFLRLGVLEPVMLVVHVAATYLTFWALWDLSLLLFHSPLAALLSTIAFTIPHLGFAGFPVFEFSLLNRTFALPFALWAVILYLRGRPLRAFLVAGLLFNIHVITVNFVMAMFLFDSVLRLKAGAWRQIALGLPLFGLAAAPVLVWRLTSPALAAQLNPEWFDVVSRGSLYNLFFLIAPYLHILFVTLAGLGTLGLYFVARRTAPAQSANHERAVLHFIVAVILILTVQTVTALVYPITIVNQLQIIRAGAFATIFGYLYFGHYLARRWQTGTLAGANFVILFSTYVLLMLPFVPLVGLALLDRVRSGRWRLIGPTLAAATPAGMFAFAMSVILPLGLWAPGIYPYGPDTAWERIQVCARENTPKAALFITPPEKWWLYWSDWRTFSERSTVVTHSELLMIALAPGYYDTWKERFEQLAPGAVEQFAGDFFQNQRTTRDAYYTLSVDDLLRVARRYGAQYIVMEQPHTLPLEKAAWTCNLDNPQYAIYAAP